MCGGATNAVQRWPSLEEVPAGYGPSVVTVGVFDGVHRGHRQVIRRTCETARELGLPAAVVTFDPHPLTVLRPAAAPVRLATLDHRLTLLAALGVDAALVLPFTPQLAAWSPEDFIRRVLVDSLHTARVTVGEDFRFGAKAAGDVDLLRRLGPSSGFTVDAIPLIADEQGRVSSTTIRRQLVEGDVESAAAALGRPHRVEGPVVHGEHRGRAIGYPTANLDLPSDTAIPADGIYAGWLTVDDARMPAAISIGTNPTFGGTLRRVEAHVLDRDDLELYGEHVAVDFAVRLRKTLRFDSVPALVAQMARDVAQTRKLTT
jgi:riboflavin kinase / FMN adenylyltransferase